ncbi:MAG: family 16 glycosylhydrolase [Dysgonamonadaceae bacterium]|jgi:beta-glucanase (GH16 family)|nr:family 16 glycosylhydrolase [Dysgonamonadaceae bacterium]
MKMHKFNLILIALSGFACSGLTAQGTGETGDYKLVWQDLFDNGTLDLASWNIEVNGNGGGNAELQYYRAENISVGNEPVSKKNCLILTAKKESFGGKPATSGRINTNDKMRFKHGKIEASIKLPHTANGLWPAFWMLGADFSTTGWPGCGEIDILEMGERSGINAGTQDRYFSGACHWGSIVNGNHPNYARATTNSYSLQDDFHLFTLIWDDSFVRMYLDLDKYPNGAPYYEMDISNTTNPELPGAFLHKPFFVIFNLAVGGNFPQIWDINQITAFQNNEAAMYVDFVKVYQKGTAGEEYYGPTLGSLNPQPDSQTLYTVYPNPAKDKFRITGPEPPKTVTLFSITGQKIGIFKNTGLYDISGLAGGCYLVTIETAGEATETFRLIKQ